MSVPVLIVSEETAVVQRLHVALKEIYGSELLLYTDDDLSAISDSLDFVFVPCKEDPSRYELEGLDSAWTGRAAVIALCPEQEPAQELLKAQGAHAGLLYDELETAVIRKTLKHAVAAKGLSDQLRATNEFYYRMFNDAPTPMWIVDQETQTFSLSNKAACESYGYTREEFRQMTIFDIRPQEDHERLREVIKNRPTTHVFDSGSWRHIKKSGEIFWTRVYSQETTLRGRCSRMVVAVNENDRIQTLLNNRLLTDQLDGQRRELDRILSSLGEVVWSCLVDNYEITYINEACYKAYGFRQDELLGKSATFFEQLHPDDHGKVEDAMVTLLEQGTVSYEFRMYHKNGTLKYFASNISLQYDERGTPVSMTGIDVDVTAQVLAEKEMHEKAAEVADILESITDSFFALDRNWRFTYANKEYERLQGIPRAALIGTNYWERFPLITDSVFYSQFHKAVQQQRNVHFTAYAPYLQKWLSINAYPNEKGLAVYFRDITMQREMEEQQLMNEQNLKALINNTEDMIWSVDTNWKLISLNQAYQDCVRALSGRAPQQGDNVLLDDFDEVQIRRWRKIYARAFRGEALRFMEEAPDGKGNTNYYELRINPIIGNKGEVIGASCFSRDVTAINQYLMAIEAQNEKLRDIAWIHSHKIRGPVASLLGLVDVLNHNVLCEEEKKECLSGIESKCRELDVLIHDINKKSASLPPPCH